MGLLGKHKKQKKVKGDCRKKENLPKRRKDENWKRRKGKGNGKRIDLLLKERQEKRTREHLLRLVKRQKKWLRKGLLLHGNEHLQKPERKKREQVLKQLLKGLLEKLG
jgi:tRNA A37 N6-isopentenylltransferase MiaA